MLLPFLTFEPNCCIVLMMFQLYIFGFCTVLPAYSGENFEIRKNLIGGAIMRRIKPRSLTVFCEGGANQFDAERY